MRGPAQNDNDRELGDAIRYGTVAAVDLAAGRCVVASGEVRTSSIRWLETRAGATRTWSPPSVGEQVVLICPEGDIAGAVALRGVASGAHPPAGNSKRELVKFSDDTVLAYDPEAHRLEILIADGDFRIVAPNGVTIEADVQITGNVAIDGDLSVTGKGTAEDDFVAAGKSLKSHKHTGVAPGGGVSGMPQ